MDWHRQGACYSEGYTLFFHEGKAGAIQVAKQAKTQYCKPCPVKAVCLQSSLLHRDKHGIWGGLTPKERAALLERIEMGELTIDEAVAESCGR